MLLWSEKKNSASAFFMQGIVVTIKVTANVSSSLKWMTAMLCSSYSQLGYATKNVYISSDWPVNQVNCIYKTKLECEILKNDNNCNTFVTAEVKLFRFPELINLASADTVQDIELIVYLQA